jgi:hypothetical protein
VGLGIAFVRFPAMVVYMAMYVGSFGLLACVSLLQMRG